MKSPLISTAALKKVVSSIDFTAETKNLPFSQGWAINHLVKWYKLRPVSWGWNNGYIAIQTAKQILVWLDRGSVLEFKGILDK